MIQKLMRILKYVLTPKIFARKVFNKIFSDQLKRIFFGFPGEEKIRNLLKEEIGEDDRVIIFPGPNSPWGYMFQRPQQLARAFANEGYKVIYMTNTSFPFYPDWNVRGLMEVEKNLYLYNDSMNAKGLLALTRYLKTKVIIWQYWPQQYKTVTFLKEHFSHLTVYDCIDHITTFLQYDEISVHHNETLRKADVVVVTAEGIKKEVSLIRDDCILLPNAVNLSDFNSILIESKEKSNLIVGYYGAIAEWFDFELIEYAAKQLPYIDFCIVGEVYSAVQDKVNRLSKYHNIKFLPRVQYSEIPKLLSNFDITMIPFLINDITENTSPVKVFEYIAGGKVTVSTPLPEIIGLEGVLVSQSKTDFVEKINLAIKLDKDKEYKKSLREVAKLHAWETRVNRFIKHISREYECNEEK